MAAHTRKTYRALRRMAPLLLAAVLVLAAGCGPRLTRVGTPGTAPPPAQQASREQLLARYNLLARQVRSLRASVRLQATTGSPFAGIVRQYHQIDGLLLAERPDRLRLIGQAPVVGTSLFDLASSGGQFRLFIPSRHEFVVGRNDAPPRPDRPLDNLRPEHLLQALFWSPIAPEQPVVLEEEETEQPPARFYVLSVIDVHGSEWEISRRIWFDRSDLHLCRIELFGPQGRLEADIQLRAWSGSAEQAFPRELMLRRPQEDYRLTIELRRLELNAAIPADRFELAQPPGSRRVVVGEPGGTP